MQPTAIARRVLSLFIGTTVAATTAFVVIPAHADDTTLTTVSGVVRVDGVPAPGIEVCVYAPVMSDSGYVDRGGCATADAQGNYTITFELPQFTDLATVCAKPEPSTADRVQFRCVGDNPRQPNAHVQLVPGGHPVFDVDVTLLPKPASGVVDDSGSPGNVVTTARPVVSGKAKVGARLTAMPGAWGPVGVKLSYRWYRNGKKIAGATQKTYRLTTRDSKKKITVAVIGRTAGSPAVTRTSAPTAKIACR